MKVSNTRKIKTCLVGFLLIIFTGANNASETNSSLTSLACNSCNLVVINLDFLRTDYTGLISGSELTPNIDRYFSNGIIFENMYSVTGSSYRSSLSVMTSSNPHIYDVDVRSFEQLRNNKTLAHWESIYKHNETISEALQGKNYSTVSLNKGFRSGEGVFLDRGFDDYQQYSIRTLIEDILPDFSSRIHKAAKPFFAMLHAVPTRLHRAFYPANRAHLVHPNINYREYNREGKLYGYAVSRNWAVSHPEQRQAEHLIYQQQLKYADDELGKFFDELKDLEDNTIIVLYSGHGTQIGDKQIYASNGVSYESNIRVPLLIKHPSVDKAIRIEETNSLLDLAPTLLDILGIQSPETFEGKSLVPNILQGQFNSAPIYGRNDYDEFVILDNWKLIRKVEYKRELFDLATDPGKSTNIYERNKLVARKLEYGVDLQEDSSEKTSRVWEYVTSPTYRFELFNLNSDPSELDNLVESYPGKVKDLEGYMAFYRQQAKEKRELIVKGLK